MKPKDARYTVAVDFDGVLHKYTTPWVNPHTIPDGPVLGAVAWLHQTIQHLDVVIYSTRCRTWRGRRAVRRWLRFWSGNCWDDAPGFRGIADVRLSYQKPPALVYLDDRAMRFEGTFPSVQQIHAARPWNKPLSRPQPNANERRLAKLLREVDEAWCSSDGNANDWREFWAAFLARRGVLAVCAKTVNAQNWPNDTPRTAAEGRETK